MNLRSIIATTLLVISFSGCARANVSKSREAYILSQPHGWIEITVTDENVPSVLPPKELPPDKMESWEPEPPSCRFLVELNNENFLYESIFPFGDEPPYIVDTGFRFPVPVGELDINIQYVGCDIENEDSASISFSSTIFIEEEMVSPIIFDGTSFYFTEIQGNTVITLEDIYNKLDQQN